METGESHTNNAFNQRFRDLVTDAGKHYRMLNTIGALIVRIGFWAHYTIVIISNPQNRIANYSGLHSKYNWWGHRVKLQLIWVCRSSRVWECASMA